MKKTKEITKTSELLPQKRNANRGTERGFQVLENSLRNLGFGRSIVVDRKGRIIGGNHTTEKAVEIGLDNVVTVRTKGDKVVVHVREDLDFDEDSRAAQLAIADNRTGELNLEWDAEILAAIKEHGEVDLSALGFTDKEVNEVLKEIERDTVDAPDAEIDRAEELLRKWKVKRGDIWEVPSLSVKGKAHRVMCGDATGSDLEVLMASRKAALVVTDPPYGVNYTGGRNPESNTPRGVILGDTEAALYSPFLTNLLKHIEPKAAVYLWFAGRNGLQVYSAVAASGLAVRALIVWNKQNAHYGNFMAQYMNKHEPLLYCVQKSCNWYGPTNEVTVWDIDQPSNNEHHSTEKPVECMARAIRNSSTLGELVVDGFLGSASTMVAAEQLGRLCYGMEIEPKYVAVSLERLSQMGLISKLIKPGKRKR